MTIQSLCYMELDVGTFLGSDSSNPILGYQASKKKDPDRGIDRGIPEWKRLQNYVHENKTYAVKRYDHIQQRRV